MASLDGPTVLLPVSPGTFYEWFDLSSRPLLKAALENARPAYGVRVEWIVDSLAGGHTRRLLRNFTQILRHPFKQRWLPEEGRRQTFAEAAKEAGEKILDDVELTLWYGKPAYDIGNVLYHPVSTCGGVRHYLRRRVYENDSVALRELQPLTIYKDRAEGDEFRAEEDRTHEWLVEFSLQVNPGHYERGMTPLFLPPDVPASIPRAWRQGASLNDKE